MPPTGRRPHQQQHQLTGRSESGPSSEGVITRTASIRSNVTGMTTLTATTTGGNGPYLSGAIQQSNAIPPRRPTINQNISSVPSRQLSVSTVSSNNTSRPGGPNSTFAPVSPIDEGEMDIGAALVADGPQYRQTNNNIPLHQPYPPSQQQYQPNRHQRNLTGGTLPPLAENDILNPEVALLADGPQYRPNQQNQQQQQQQYQNPYDFPQNVPLLPQGGNLLPTPVKGDYLTLASDGAADGRGGRYPAIQRSLSQQQQQQQQPQQLPLPLHIPLSQGGQTATTGDAGGAKIDYLSLAADGSNDLSPQQHQYPLIQRQPTLLQHHHHQNLSLSSSQQQSPLPPLPPLPGAAPPGPLTEFIYPHPHSNDTGLDSRSITPTPNNPHPQFHHINTNTNTNTNTSTINPNYAPSSTGLNLELRYDGTGDGAGRIPLGTEPPSPDQDRYSISMSMSDVSSVSTALPPYQRYESGCEPQRHDSRRSRGST